MNRSIFVRIKFLPIFFILICGALTGATGAIHQNRTWTSLDGREIYATLIESSEDSVTVRRDDGQVFTIPISRLGRSDQNYVRSLSSDLLGDYRDLAKVAKEARRKAGVPALGICIISDFEIYGIGYSSNQQDKLGDKAKRSDPISIASCTKSMNATLAAIVVSQGEMNWNTTLVDVFPELSAFMNKRYQRVSLEQLLSHTAGAPGMNEFWKSKEYIQACELEGTPREQRYGLLRIVTAQNPIFKPGDDFEYSNAGHYIAASMMEKVMDQTWESMMEELVLQPLDLSNTTPIRSLDRGSAPQLTAPGGGIHSTMEDFANFCIFQMQFKPDNVLGIKRKDFERMHEASGDSNYGLGFFTITRNWSKGTILQHNGRNGLCASTFWLAPKEGFGIFAIAPGGHSDSDFWNDTIAFLLDEML